MRSNTRLVEPASIVHPAAGLEPHSESQQPDSSQIKASLSESSIEAHRATSPCHLLH